MVREVEDAAQCMTYDDVLAGLAWPPAILKAVRAIEHPAVLDTEGQEGKHRFETNNAPRCEGHDGRDPPLAQYAT